MYNQRQKKRSAQFKKKYHEGKAKDKQREGPWKPQESLRPVTKPANEGGKTGQEATPTAQRPVPLSSEEPVKHDQKKYSRRKIASNWDRYGEEEEGEVGYPRESEEELHQRLIQLLNLPSKPTLPMPGEEFGFVENKAADEPTGSYLSLDCEALARALSSLPLHQRLDLDLELVELCGEDIESEVPESQPNSIDLSVCSLRHQHSSTMPAHASGFQFLSSLGADTKSNNLSALRAEFTKPVTERTRTAERQAFALELPQKLKGVKLEDDDELDQLLSADVPQPRPRPSGGQTTPKTQMIEVPSQSSAGARDPTSTELDAALDELLA